MPRKYDAIASVETYCLIVIMALLHSSISMPTNSTRMVSRREDDCFYEGLLRDMEECGGVARFNRPPRHRQKDICRDQRKCYDDLRTKCQGNSDAIRLLNNHASRQGTSHFCRDAVSLETFHNKDTCFRSFVNTTLSCSDALVNYLEKFLSTENFRSACRLIGTVLNCFRDILDHIETGCDQEGQTIFHKFFIQPSLDDVRLTITDHCTGHLPPFSLFFSSVCDCRRTSCQFVVVVSIVVARLLTKDS